MYAEMIKRMNNLSSPNAFVIYRLKCFGIFFLEGLVFSKVWVDNCLSARP